MSCQDLFFQGLQEHICSGKDIEWRHLLRILQKCTTRDEHAKWVEADGFEKSILPGEGHQGSLSNFHNIRCNCPEIRGRVYLSWGSEQPKKAAEFTGSFGGRRQFKSEKGVPMIAQNKANFTLKADTSIKYKVTLVNLLEETDPATAKQLQVSSVAHAKAGPRSCKWLLNCNGSSPFKKESAKHVALVKWECDWGKVEPHCQMLNVAISDFNEIRTGLSGYMRLDTCDVNHVEVKPLAESKIQLPNAEEQLITCVNHMLNQGALKIIVKESRVAKTDLSLYYVQLENLGSEIPGRNAEGSENERSLGEGFHFGEREPSFLDEEIFATRDYPNQNPTQNPMFVNTDEGFNAMVHNDQSGVLPDLGSGGCDASLRNEDPSWGLPNLDIGDSEMLDLDSIERAEIQYMASQTELLPNSELHGNMVVSGRVTAQEVSIKEDGHLFLGGGADILQLSDGRTKANIKQMGEDSYKKLMMLQTYFFSYKESTEQDQRAGFIAQQVQEHIKEAVKQDGNGVHYISLGTLIPFIVQGLQTQDKSIQKQDGLIMLILGALLDLTRKWREDAKVNGEDSVASDEDGVVNTNESTDPGAESDCDSEKEFFCKMSDTQDKVAYLMDALEEDDNVKGLFHNFVKTVDVKVLWRCMEKATRDGRSLKRDNEQCSMGREFMNLVRQYKKDQEVKIKAAKSPKIAAELRSYQKKAVEVSTEDWDPTSKQTEQKNFCFVAPTGSGKTMIFIECIRRGLALYPGLKAVVIIPNVALSVQHETSFMMNNFGDAGWKVESYSSANPVNQTTWLAELEKQSVMIMTAQILVNLLEDCAAHMQQIDLLILDEVHHARSQSPYKKIMEHYNKAKKCGVEHLPKVLGFSASPANAETRAGTYKKLVALRELLQAKLVLILDDHHEIQQHVPAPDERTIWIDPRPQDEEFDRGLRKFMAQANDGLSGHLRKLVTGKTNDPVLVSKFVACFGEKDGRAAAENFLEDHPDLCNLSNFETTELLASAQLLQECNNSLQILKEFGYEQALAHCAQKCIEILDLYHMGSTDATRVGFFRDLVIQLCNTAPVNDSRFIACAIGKNIQAHGRSFPKFVELLTFLERDYVKEKESFHGMIFIETRAGVYQLAHMLRSDPRMKSVQFIEFTGHGSLKKSDYANSKGMKPKIQEKQLIRFRQEGRKVLVATQAAEEGLDVVECEFVIRYTAPKTGIQRVQSKGRSRKRGGVYVSLLTKKSLDEKMESKSKAEESNLQWVMRKINSIIID